MIHLERWAEQLARGLAEMGIELAGSRRRGLLDYLSLLEKWNRTYNLTAVRDPEQMVSRQLLDSLSILHLLRGARILDVGTGPGLPGIPLAIASPDRWFTLLDSNGKKTRFLQQVKSELALDNVEVVRSRVEAYHPASGFDTVTSRAFAGVGEMRRLALHLVAANGCLLAMRGAISAEEIEILKETGGRVEVVPLRVPWTSRQRHAIVCRPATDHHRGE